MSSTFSTVNVDHGVLRGKKVTLEEGNAYFSFQGVPYAKPPLGPLRFKVAQEPDRWTGIRDALKEGPSCPQIEWLLNLPYRGEEDCLYLNVYTTKLPSEGGKLNLPVMVWIHGGGFEAGSGDTLMYGSQYLVTEDVVLVTINYRLGVFGFLSVDHEALPDNLGFKDQVAALRWVRKNIQKFGGDENNITIFGESAGAASVNLHMLSPMSKGLFHKAIIQSGNVMCPWGEKLNARQTAFELGQELGCETSDVHELVKFLSSIDARKLIEAYEVMKKKQILQNQNGNGDILPIGPVVERNVKYGEEIFLPASPKELMRSGKINSVPCIIGLNNQEGILCAHVTGVLKNPSALKLFIDNFEHQIPSYIKSSLTPKDLSTKIKEFYFKGQDTTQYLSIKYVELMGDLWFTNGTDEAVKLLSRSSPVFYYNFAFSGSLNIFKNFIEATDFTGAAHLDELGYLFGTTHFKVPPVLPNSPEWQTMRRMVKMWTNFAKFGNPTPSLDSIVNVEWPPYTEKDPTYLGIDNTLEVRRNLCNDRVNFWNTI